MSIPPDIAPALAACGIFAAAVAGFLLAFDPERKAIRAKRRQARDRVAILARHDEIRKREDANLAFLHATRAATPLPGIPLHPLLHQRGRVAASVNPAYADARRLEEVGDEDTGTVIVLRAGWTGGRHAAVERA